MSDDWIELFASPLDIASAIAFVTDSRAGGMDVFLGTTRAETHADGRVLLSLDYEAFAEMAVQQLRLLIASARDRWPIVKLAIFHRTGVVKIGEPSVIIAVSTPHRAESFDACRFLIDRLKLDVPIWKREVWADGTTTWVDPAAAKKAKP